MMIYIKNGDAWVETADADIPPAILAALKADGTHKNLKIHFPNGEIPDFDNSFIVRESLRFTESICSQDTFKFGLAEASVLEFETVGVGNMRGMTIEANLFYGPDADPVAYVPLGVFTVESCPRDAGVLMRRKVRAYTNSGAGIVQNNPIELLKLKSGIGQRDYKYRPDLFRLLTAAIGWTSPSYLAPYTRTQISIPAPQPSPLPRPVTIYAGQYTIELYYSTYTIGFGPESPLYSFAVPADGVYAIELPPEAKTEMERALAWVRATASEYDFNSSPGIETMRTIRSSLMSNINSFGPGRQGNRGPLYFAEHVPIMYPYGLGTMYAAVRFGNRIRIIEYTDTGPQIAEWESAYAGSVSLYALGVPASGVTGSFPPTATINLSGTDFSTYVDAYDLGAIAEGYFEAQGQFCRMARSGGIEIITLAADKPLTILPGEYSSCWWTEDGPQRIGTVRVRYMAGDEEQVVDISIGDGAGLYDMTDNGYFSAMEGIDYATIEAFIQTHFAPAVEGLALTEIDLDMRALPHVQAGRALSVVAEDGEIVNTYMLRREMSGIQQISDAITCPPPGSKEA